MLLTLLQIATEPATQSSAIDFTFLFIKMVAALVVACIAAVLVLKYAVPRLSLTKKFQADNRIKILSRVSLGPKQHLYLVKIDEKCILLGVTDQAVNKIIELET